MASRNVGHLRRHGPSTVEELPNKEVTVADKQNGVWRFGPTVGSARRPRSVYYLRDDHDETAVVRRWFEANSDIIEGAARSAVVAAVDGYGRDFDSVDVESICDGYGVREWSTPVCEDGDTEPSPGVVSRVSRAIRRSVW